jgi:hypothetical protein
VAAFHQGEYRVEHRRVVYDDVVLFRAFEHPEVPTRVFIYRAFFGGRFVGWAACEQVNSER